MRILPTICVHMCSVASVSCHSSRTSSGQVWLDMMGERYALRVNEASREMKVSTIRVSGWAKDTSLPPIRRGVLIPPADAGGTDAVLDFAIDRMLESLHTKQLRS